MSNDDTKDLDSKQNEGQTGPDPFFFVALLALLPTIAAAIYAPNKAPSYALEATGVYRLQVGLIFYGASYILGLVLVLAWQGRSLGQLNIASVVETDLPDPSQPDENLAVAKEAFEEFEEQVNSRLDSHDDSLLAVGKRLDGIDGGEPPKVPQRPPPPGSEGPAR
jgi:hypothetical protein